MFQKKKLKYSSNGECTQCSAGCITCSSELLCTVCNVNAGFQLIESSCVSKCKSPCSTCLSDVTKCTSCQRGTYLLNNICYDNCPSQFYNSKNQQCDKCILGCLICTDGSTCTTCDTANNYLIYPSSSTTNICISPSTCISPCATCPTQCGSCISTYKLQGNVCKLSCDSGYYSNSSNVCQKCDRTCKECTDTSVTCTACTDTKILSNNLCVEPVLLEKKL